MRKQVNPVSVRPLWSLIHTKERLIVLVLICAAFFFLKSESKLSGAILAMAATYVYAILSLRLDWVAKSWLSEELWNALWLLGMVISVFGIILIFRVPSSFLSGLVFSGVMNIGFVMQMYANKFGRKVT
jgi:hypothetical protein